MRIIQTSLREKLFCKRVEDNKNCDMEGVENLQLH